MQHQLQLRQPHLLVPLAAVVVDADHLCRHHHLRHHLLAATKQQVELELQEYQVEALLEVQQRVENLYEKLRQQGLVMAVMVVVVMEKNHRGN